MTERPVVPGEVIGWRVWGVRQAHRNGPPILISLDLCTRWPHQAYLHADCRFGYTHPAPDENCQCGLYAARDLEHLSRSHYFADRNRPRYLETSGIIAYGQVAMAGLVIPHARGWRAAQARPVSLRVPYDQWRLANALRDRYQVPVTLANPPDHPDQDLQPWRP